MPIYPPNELDFVTMPINALTDDVIREQYETMLRVHVNELLTKRLDEIALTNASQIVDDMMIQIEHKSSMFEF